MDYNDFQILSNEEYNLLNSHYALTQPFDRKTSIFQICNDIYHCKNVLLNQLNKHNKKILNALETVKSVLNKTHDNLTSLFDCDSPDNKTIKSLNLFEFIKKLISLTSKITQWAHNEQKEYYKSLAQKTTIEFLNMLENLISTIAESNIYFFKYM